LPWRSTPCRLRLLRIGALSSFPFCSSPSPIAEWTPQVLPSTYAAVSKHPHIARTTLWNRAHGRPLKRRESSKSTVPHSAGREFHGLIFVANF
ncbi:uncharacterized protein BDR25DRAFT_88915, partial [Lindgomyces ingoldianus]